MEGNAYLAVTEVPTLEYLTNANTVFIRNKSFTPLNLVNLRGKIKETFQDE
jgi:hypothetical protein